jgi:hypothetical protein
MIDFETSSNHQRSSQHQGKCFEIWLLNTVLHLRQRFYWCEIPTRLNTNEGMPYFLNKRTTILISSKQLWNCNSNCSILSVGIDGKGSAIKKMSKHFLSHKYGSFEAAARKVGASIGS